MIFTDLRFFAFFALVFGVHWALRGHTARKAALLVASWVFYAAWDWRFLGLLWFTTLVDWTAALGIARDEAGRTRKRWLLVSIAGNLGVLGFFKYWGFFVDSAADLLGRLGLHASLPTLRVLLPWGISFYTFHTLGYTIDVYRRRVVARRSLLDMALFVAFFPQLVAGPIARAAAFFPQLDRPRTWADVRVRASLLLFLGGFVKKACLSDAMAEIVDRYYASPSSYTASSGWIANALCATQVYCDFSGYTDMALGSAGLLGYELAPNFDFPYLSPNPSEHWRRWHMSLSSWFRDYVYYPLGGSRGSPMRTRLNILLTLGLIGLWHGAAWHFVAWGALGGVAMVVQRDFAKRFPPPAVRGPVRMLVAVAALNLWLCVQRTFFRTATWHEQWAATRALLALHAEGATQIHAGWLVLPAAAALVHVGNYFGLGKWVWGRLPSAGFALAYGASWMLALTCAHPTVRAFTYFQF